MPAAPPLMNCEPCVADPATRFWTAARIAEVVGGEWSSPPADGLVPLAGLSTDSRGLRPGQVFLALRGENFDGHDYLAAAAAAGAALAIVDRDAAAPPGLPRLRVADTQAALTRLASSYRDALAAGGTRVVAVAGSNGKTGTRHLIHAALSAAFRGTQSPKSFNNHLGVPLTLLAAREGDGFVVVEVGTNHPGEIAALGAIVRPDAAVITSIGHEHMEFFGTLGGVAREEIALLEAVRPGGLGIVAGRVRLSGNSEGGGGVLDNGRPHADCALAATRLASGVRVVRYGSDPDAAVRLGRVLDERGGRLRFEVEGAGAVVLPWWGAHHISNALAAFAVGRWAGVDDARIVAALRGAAGPPMRMQPLRLGSGDASVLLVNDAYNANPSSVTEAIRFLTGAGATDAGRRVLVLGDMRELGESGPAAHGEIGRRVARAGGSRREANGGRVDLAVLVGPLSAEHAAGPLRAAWPADTVHAFPEWDEGVPARVAELMRPGDLVLLKASRGMRLERLVPALEARFGEACSADES